MLWAVGAHLIDEQDAPAGGHKHSCGMNVILPYNIYAMHGR